MPRASKVKEAHSKKLKALEREKKAAVDADKEQKLCAAANKIITACGGGLPGFNQVSCPAQPPLCFLLLSMPLQPGNCPRQAHEQVIGGTYKEPVPEATAKDEK